MKKCFCVIVLLIVTFVFQNSALSGNLTGSSTKVIIDTDMAADDWLAILYLLRHPGVEVLGITVTGAGEAHCEEGTRHALDFLLLTGQETKNIPVACGDEAPSDGYHVFPSVWRDAVDSLMGLNLPENPAKPVAQHAVDLIIELLEREEEPVQLVTLGPLTNVAGAFEKSPAIQEKIKRIYIMGGAVKTGGNLIIPGFTEHLKNAVAEWNLYVDPVAAQKVIRADVPVTLVALDGTNKALVTQEFTAQFKERVQSPTAKFVDNVFDKNAWLINFGAYYFWDPLTTAIVADEKICACEEFSLDVVVKYTDEAPAGELPAFSKTLKDGTARRHFDLYESGQTVISDSGKPVQVCVEPDVGAFQEQFIQILNR
jgi:pyrimidine-specific ribonucleoside hydrolase